jgi:carbamoyltransferase
MLEAPKGWRQSIDFFQFHDLSQYNLNRYLSKSGIKARVRKYSHHQSHAASAFFPSPFSNAAILTIDGVGEWSTSTVGLGEGTDIKIFREMRFPDSIGLLFATFTTYCGFKVNSGEYKLMGLAPYGKPIYKDSILREIVRVFEDGSIKLNIQFFDFTRGTKMYSKKFEQYFGRIARCPDQPIEEFHCDIASSIQGVLEEIVVLSTKFALKLTGSRNLVLAGGVALNCVANSKILEILPVENIFIQPAAGDAGGALGAALLGYRDVFGNRDEWRQNIAMSHCFLGTSYSNSDIEYELRVNMLTFMSLPDDDDYCSLNERTTELLLEGKVVGWFQGKMEFGPRSLGARSIIADARNPEMQKRLNLKIKNRESFRPFAPMVLEEFVHQWFKWPENERAPFMLFTSDVLDQHLIESENIFPQNGNLSEWVSKVRSLVPAITHVDNSARIQTVDSKNPIHGVLKRFYEITGVPILVNTSFNVRGEPIVESPQDAIDCFLQTDMDVLVIGKYLLLKSDQSKDALLKSQSRRRNWEND